MYFFVVLLGVDTILFHLLIAAHPVAEVKKSTLLAVGRAQLVLTITCISRCVVYRGHALGSLPPNGNVEVP